ncbi:RNA-binding protein fusilli-like isoform X1 [Armigeres subalbatus]|uniref:RNA-binding protein fusilli-like isoform X1 n=1 Tax=Armigeres subalbatus TaxID=124917 RepID=UPI002ED3ABB7
MLLGLTILAGLAISSATAEPHLDHAAAYGYGAHLFGGINPELYATARALSPLQYASSVPMVYANQYVPNSLHRSIKPVVSAPLQYAASLPVSYAAPQASLAYSSPYASHPNAHLAYGVQTPLAASYAAAAAAHSTQFHTPTQYASYAAAPVHAGHASVLGSSAASASSPSLNYAAALANAQAYGGSSLYAQQQPQSPYPYHQQYSEYQQQQQQQQQSYQQHLDAAFGRSAAELYGRGVPFAYPGRQVASSAAGQEIARQMAVQLSPGYHQEQAASAYGEARTQTRTDSE